MKIPIYLSGAVRNELSGDSRFGFMLTPNIGNRAPIETNAWGADTGLFSPSGVRTFDLDRYLGWLAARPAATNLFATAPDVVGDAWMTLCDSLPVLRLIRELGYKAALVGQDGLENHNIPWNEFDCFFIGGSTEWKLSAAAAQLSLEAKSRGKWLHMGRVNSFKRFRYAASIGCDSVDGTFLAFGPTVNLAKLNRWFENFRQGEMQWQ